MVRRLRSSIRFLLIHEAQQGCRDATYEPSRFPVAVPYPSPHRATPAYVVVTSSDLDTSRNKASVSGLSWISRIRFMSRAEPKHVQVGGMAPRRAHSACRVSRSATSLFVLAAKGSPLRISRLWLFTKVFRNLAGSCLQVLCGRIGQEREGRGRSQQRQVGNGRLTDMDAWDHPATSAILVAMRFAADLTGSLARWA